MDDPTLKKLQFVTVLFLGIICKYSEELLIKKSYYVKILKIKQNSSTFTKAQKILDLLILEWEAAVRRSEAASRGVL